MIASGQQPTEETSNLGMVQFDTETAQGAVIKNTGRVAAVPFWY